jgi:hypothetical protein
MYLVSCVHSSARARGGGGGAGPPAPPPPPPPPRPPAAPCSQVNDPSVFLLAGLMAGGIWIIEHSWSLSHHYWSSHTPRLRPPADVHRICNVSSLMYLRTGCSPQLLHQYMIRLHIGTHRLEEHDM